jgi:hypothetical protein
VPRRRRSPPEINPPPARRHSRCGFPRTAASLFRRRRWTHARRQRAGPPSDNDNKREPDGPARRRRCPEPPRIARCPNRRCAVTKLFTFKVHTKHPERVLLHGGGPRGAERIAACWADNRKVPQVLFKPDWTRHRNAAPFKHDDQMLEALPIGVVVFPGSGIAANLADKAKLLGIPVWAVRR